MFADDTKLLRKIRNHKNCEELQNDINKIYEWRKTWRMEKIEKKSLLEQYKKVQFSPKKYRYFDWTKGRGDNDKECASVVRKTG